MGLAGNGSVVQGQAGALGQPPPGWPERVPRSQLAGTSPWAASAAIQREEEKQEPARSEQVVFTLSVKSEIETVF